MDYDNMDYIVLTSGNNRKLLLLFDKVLSERNLNDIEMAMLLEARQNPDYDEDDILRAISKVVPYVVDIPLSSSREFEF